MTEKEHLLVCLSEECAELTQAVAKGLRFGLRDINPQTQRTNVEDIMFEYADVVAVFELISERFLDEDFHTFSIIELMNPEKHIERKKQRVLKWLEYAKKQETVQ